MKQTLIYLAGTLMLLPCCLMFTDNPLVDIFAMVYTFVVVKSPSYSQKAKRFWRAWHKQNIKITSIIG